MLVIKIGWAVFEKIRFLDFSKFVHNFSKKNFFELILGVNLSCNGNHLPSQYGSNPSVGTQTMLILLRPLFAKFSLKWSWETFFIVFSCIFQISRKIFCKIKKLSYTGFYRNLVTRSDRSMALNNLQRFHMSQLCQKLSKFSWTIFLRVLTLVIPYMAETQQNFKILNFPKKYISLII